MAWRTTDASTGGARWTARAPPSETTPPGTGSARTWKHYILSPNSTDGIELARLRRLATERRFYEVAREALLSATIDVEHFARVELLR